MKSRTRGGLATEKETAGGVSVAQDLIHGISWHSSTLIDISGISV
jgi:hypothetical protein